MSDKLCGGICWSYTLVLLFMKKYGVAFSFIVLGTLKWDCDVRTS